MKKKLKNAPMSPEELAKMSDDRVKNQREEFVYIPKYIVKELLWLYYVDKNDSSIKEKLGDEDKPEEYFQINSSSYRLIEKEIIKEKGIDGMYMKYSYKEDIISKIRGGNITINPDVIVYDKDGDKDYIKISAYSFGPIDPLIFFRDDTYRIVWILKEPYCEDVRELTKEIIKVYDQASNYRNYSVAQGTPTIQKLYEYTREFLEGMKISYEGSDEYVYAQVMKHVCIIEVNHFPGLAIAERSKKRSDDCFINNWFDRRYNDIIEDLKFYNPHVIIGGFTLDKKFDLEDFKDVFERFNSKKLKIFDDLITAWCCTHGKEDSKVENDINPQKSPEYILRNIKYLGESGKAYIQSYHPSYGKFVPDMGREDGEVIYKLTSDRFSKD